MKIDTPAGSGAQSWEQDLGKIISACVARPQGKEVVISALRRTKQGIEQAGSSRRQAFLIRVHLSKTLLDHLTGKLFAATTSRQRLSAVLSAIE